MSKLIIQLYLNTSRTNKRGTAPLLIMPTLNGVRKHINTGIHLNSKLWNRGKQFIKSTHSQSSDIGKLLRDKKR